MYLSLSERRSANLPAAHGPLWPQQFLSFLEDREGRDDIHTLLAAIKYVRQVRVPIRGATHVARYPRFSRLVAAWFDLRFVTELLKGIPLSGIFDVHLTRYPARFLRH
jgi:hypothetical protein